MPQNREEITQQTHKTSFASSSTWKWENQSSIRFGHGGPSVTNIKMADSYYSHEKNLRPADADLHEQ